MVVAELCDVVILENHAIEAASHSPTTQYEGTNQILRAVIARQLRQTRK
jgi:hypothetical protein